MTTKSKVQHTPGPWRCEVRTADDPAAIVYEGESGTIYEYFVIDTHGNDLCSVYDRSDARLIAAAPDLLIAANQALAYFECMRDKVAGLTQHYKIEVEENLRAAITKAEGK